MPFALRMLQLLPDLLGTGEGKPTPKDVVQGSSGPACFEKMILDNGDHSWTKAAELVSVAVYLRGNVNLNLPKAWKAVFPKRL